MTPETPTPSMVYQKIFFPSPGGGRDRGPWGPNAIQYATDRGEQSVPTFQATGQSQYPVLRTSFFLLESHFMPIDLHPIPQGHPQIGLLLWRHPFPSLLNACKSRVRYSVDTSMPLLVLSRLE